ncbi:MAG: hypothetical protein IRY90_15185, partial [Actinomadura rubrobrunea]|nr:hypothetical protein [Actinomadura rubrobrunea]
MARIFFFTMPITGHVRPALPVARELTAAGHEVHWYCGRLFEPLITRNGAVFLPSSVRLRSVSADGDVLQDLGDRKPGLSGFKKIIRELFIDSIPAYAAEVGPLLDEIRPDVVVADHSFLAAPMLARRKDIRT